jgi:hypothetical protein
VYRQSAGRRTCAGSVNRDVVSASLDDLLREQARGEPPWSAKATLQEISVLASDNGLVLEEAAAFEVLAHVHRLEGDRGDMTSCLQRAIDRYEEAGMKADAARLTAWLRDNR